MDWQTAASAGAASGVVSTLLVNLLTERLKSRWTTETEELRARWNKELQEFLSRFSLGVDSHMAAVAFDKRAEFCERYMKEAVRTLNTPDIEGRFGASDTAELINIRRAWSIWLPQRLYNDLKMVEESLSNAGARAYEARTIEHLRQTLGTEYLSSFWVGQTRPRA